MRRFTQDDELAGAEFVDTDLRGARFVRGDLSGIRMRAVFMESADIDAPWLCDGDTSLHVNGVDVAPLVEAELNRRFPGRADRRAETPEALRAAWNDVQQSWDVAVGRAEGMRAGTVDVSVDGEWTFAQTLRHLVMATDTWLRGAVQEVEQPYHPVGVPPAEYETDGYDPSVFSTPHPSYDEVLAVRAERVAMVRDYLAGATPELLDETHASPWAPDYRKSVTSCLHHPGGGVGAPALRAARPRRHRCPRLSRPHARAGDSARAAAQSGPAGRPAPPSRLRPRSRRPMFRSPIVQRSGLAPRLAPRHMSALGRVETKPVDEGG